MAEHLLRLEIEIGKNKRRKRPKFCAFLDIEKAFDGLERDSIIIRLEQLNFNSSIIKVIADLYGKEKIEVYKGSDKIGQYVRERGIRQGCTLSPVIFN